MLEFDSQSLTPSPPVLVHTIFLKIFLDLPLLPELSLVLVQVFPAAEGWVADILVPLTLLTPMN